MRRIIAQARKELTQIVRDWRTLALALVLPIVLLMLLSAALSLTVNDLPIAVQDFDGSSASNNFIDAFRASITFRVVAWPGEKSVEQALASHAARAAAAFNQQLSNAAQAAPVQTSMRLWFNPGLSSKKFYGPGVFVLGISMFPPLLAALAMAKESEQKTILQVYVSSISAAEFLMGKILAFMAVALAECLVMASLLFTYFGLSLAGDPTPLIVATILYV